MKKKLPALLLSAALLLTAGCGGAAPSPTPAEEDGVLHILATTYPLYLFTTAVTVGAENVEVSLLVNQTASCLHDYTLTVADMKAIEKADVIVLNGGGLEDFMSDALNQSSAAVIDCSEHLDLFPAPGHEGHDHGAEYDPHIWMDPDRAVQIMGDLSLALSQLVYGENWAEHGEYHTAFLTAKDQVTAAAQTWDAELEGLSHRDLITFHNGFAYFADCFGLNLLKAIEEEEGSEASAAEIRGIIDLIGSHDIPAIFTEKNGSDSTARAIARETGVEVYQLDMIMSGSGTGIQPYLDAMEANVNTILEALG